jgi:teichuronic acid biosynthesis glycosyltransferase TuaC
VKLLFISSVFPNAIDTSRGCFNGSLVRALAKEHEVDVVSPIPWVDLVKGRRHGVPIPLCRRVVDPAGYGIHYVPFLYTPKVLRRWYGKFYWASIAGTVRSLVRTHRPELVISYWAHPDGEAAVRIGRLLGVPSCVIIGGSDVLILTRDPNRRRRIRGVLRATDAVITVNEDLKNAVIGLGIRAEAVHVWRQGIDASRFQPGDRLVSRQRLEIPDSSHVVFWAGRMVRVKGLDVLLQTCALLRTRGVEYRLYLVGDGPLRRDLTAQAEALGLAAHVAFVGPKGNDELPDWYRAADLTVLPSRSEGLPNVLRESLACGTPFVASDVGGIAEIAYPGYSLLVAPEDPVSLADAIERGLARWGGKRGGTPPGFQTWEESANSLIEIMRQHVASRTRWESVPSRTTSLAPTDWTGLMNSDQPERPMCQSPAPDRSRVLVEGAAQVEAKSHSKVRAAPSWRRQVIRWALSATLPPRLFLTRGPRRARSVCLTFDDGPDPVLTPPLLDVLRDCGVRATFFVIGEKVERDPEIVRRMVAEGHCVGSHSFHHGNPESTSAAQLLDDVHRTAALLSGVLGQKVTLFRPPHGKLKAAALWGLWRAGQTVVLWNVDPKDYARPTAHDVRDWFVARRLRGGDLILLHDRFPHAISILPDLARQVRALGLSFATISDWLS